MSNGVAILIDTSGEVTSAQFDGLAEPDHPGGPLWYIRSLIDSADPHGIDLLKVGDLVAWIDGRAFTRSRSANVVASLIFKELLSAPLAVVCGPLMITGGTRDHPRAMTAEQVATALWLLDLQVNSQVAES